ncbi:neuroendocrine protein 7B2 isoform X3 [Sitodiplosis mosellana]|uniref:neuroendocrine protein 7B2 isoform X3 n=1 Tax=Sitodiplosis mosellana TaxID=263140 RepID=UPI0024437830|nr:neuroendocrine protein 7B2 isoform X3 [Sitodiplosis mosellana]
MHKRYVNTLVVLFVCAVFSTFGADGYLSTQAVKDPYISDLLLHEIVNRMGKGLSDVSDSYLEPMPDLPVKEMPSRLSLMARATKDLEAEQLDYDSILNGERTGHPSMRDQEYLEHSSLFGHIAVTGGQGEVGQQYFKLKPKTDASLPAYCNPPNPCPVGYSEEQGCINDFENTAAFSRDYQAAQECMCDGEHMFDCPGPKDSSKGIRQMNSDLESFLARQFGDKNFMAKKYQGYKEENPFLTGQKLPIAAKKGHYYF